jgi:hypothetical protein
MAPLIQSHPIEIPGTFHWSNKHIPFEILCMIMDYATKGIRGALLPIGPLPTIAQVSPAFRAAYLAQESENDFGIGARVMPVGGKRHGGVVCKRRYFRPLIGETLSFPDLKTMAKYFHDGPGCVGQDRLAEVKFVRVRYRDDAQSYSGYTLEYVYEALELLYANRSRMSLQRLQVAADGFHNGISVETPGMWSLLKLRGLRHVILTGWVWSRPWNRHVSNAVRKRLRWNPHRKWQPLGFENPGSRFWPRIQHLDLAQQWQWYDERSRNSQDRATVQRRRLHKRKTHDRLCGVSRLARVRRRSRAAEEKRRQARASFSNS